jgi:DNA repair photolyase
MAAMDGDRLFELRRRAFDTPGFRGLEFIEVEAKSIINHVPGGGMPFEWTINPYRGCSHACTYCFARPTHTYMDMNTGRDFETKIVVKVNAVERLRADLKARRWKGDHIAMGTATDPYQRAEGKYRLMPGIIRTLIEFANPFSILTKGTLILRDLPLLAEAAGAMPVSTAMSIAHLDHEVWRTAEPGTPHPRKRMEAVARLNDAGVPCGVMMMPILPGISDDAAGMRATVTAAVEAGATFITTGYLHLRPGVREEFMGWLAAEHPGLVGRYETMYPKVYPPSSAQDRLKRKVAVMVQDAGGLQPREHARFSLASTWRGPRSGTAGGTGHDAAVQLALDVE